MARVLLLAAFLCCTAITVLLAVVVNSVVTSAADRDAEWELFKLTNNKQYTTSPADEVLRRRIWEANSALIEAHNLRFELGQESYEVSMNHLGDYSQAEVKKMLNGWRPDNSETVYASVPRETFQSNSTATTINPPSVDWREIGVVSSVKNQGKCASCWAFSAIGSLEAQQALKSGKFTELSEQNLIDCSIREGNDGCSGGWMDDAFEYIRRNRGINSAHVYPYVGRDGRCAFKKNAIGAVVASFVEVSPKNEQDLQHALAQKGPISIAIDADHYGFQFYKSGIYFRKECSQDIYSINHGMLAVGYGELVDANGKGIEGHGAKYYIVKNSWGTAWGDEGYVMMARDRENHCGIATKASYPKV